MGPRGSCVAQEDLLRAACLLLSDLPVILLFPDFEMSSKPVIAYLSPMVLPAEEAWFHKRLTGMGRYKVLVLAQDIANETQLPVGGVVSLSMRWSMRDDLVYALVNRSRECPRDLTLKHWLYIMAMASIRPTVIHASSASMGVFALPIALFLSIPLSVNIGEEDIADPRHCRKEYRDLFDRADALIVTSDCMASALEGVGCPARKIRLIAPGVDTDVLERPLAATKFQIPNSKSQTRAQNTKRLPFEKLSPCATEGQPYQSTVRFINIGAAREGKGLEVLLRAFKKLVVKGMPVSLTVIGDGPSLDGLVNMAVSLGIFGKVSFLGHIEHDIAMDYLQNAHIFVAPVSGSGQGNLRDISRAVLEAQAAGVPVISTRQGAMPQLIADGENGILLEEPDVDSVAEKMALLASDSSLRHKMGLAAIRNARDRFSSSRELGQYEKLYDELTASPRGRSPFSRILIRNLFSRAAARMIISGIINRGKRLGPGRQRLNEHINLLGHSLQGNMLQIYFEMNKKLDRRYVIFTHLYPENAELLPLDRRKYGFINLDHEPFLPTTHWERKHVYVDRLDLSHLKKGKYSTRLGFCFFDGVRMPLDGIPNDEIVLENLKVR